MPDQPDRTRIGPRERLIVALDVPSAERARALVETLGDSVRFYKLGLELVTAGGYLELVEWLTAQGKQVFVDLKLFDVPATVAAAVRGLRGRGVRFVTVHGNQAIMEAAAEAAADDPTLEILAVTVLTSLDRADLDDLGFDCDVAALVRSRARRAAQAGCAGVVASGLELAALRAELGDRALVISPGIRPLDNRPADDQKRVVTPGEAIREGADYIVVGRPIRDAEDPHATAEAIQAEIADACG